MRQLLVLLACLLPVISQANTLSVNKPRIMLDAKHNRDEFRIFNPTKEFQTYRLGIIDMQMDELGNINEVESLEHSARQLLRVGPRMGKNIAPDLYQSFRVMLKRKGLEQGEFRSHILMESLLPPAEENQGVVVRPNIRYSIPVIIRHGDLNAKISISDVELIRYDDGRTEVNLQLNRSGNRSVYGALKASVAGIVEPVHETNGLAVYTELSHRKFQFIVDEKLPSSGELVIEFIEDPAFGGDQATAYRMPLEQFSSRPAPETAQTTP